MSAPMGCVTGNMFNKLLSRYCLQSSMKMAAPSWSVHRAMKRKYSMKSSRNFLSLHDRGIFHSVFPVKRTAELEKTLIEKPVTVYCGFDPTAESLHIGNLLAVIALIHCQRGGHTPICVIGGATALIGDPSGKTTDRQQMDVSEVEYNVSSIHESLHRIFSNHFHYIWNKKKDLPSLKIINNKEWYQDKNIIDFLSGVGRQFRMNKLLSRHSVQSRLSSSLGMSFTEFTYQVFQSYDWMHLLKNHNCAVQIGGQDQYGNIVSGYEFIKSVTDDEVYGLTVPLITTNAGTKLGKSEGNAVWLNNNKTSAFSLYQYFVNRPDSEMENLLKLFTFLSENEIESVLQKQRESSESRPAQKKLAEQVTLLVHGEDGVERAKRATEALYNKNVESLSKMDETELDELFSEAVTVRLIHDIGMTVLDLCMKAKCFRTEVEAVKIMQMGGVHINHCQTKMPDLMLMEGQHILPNKITLIRIGKKNYYIVKWEC